jgi:hypothetical protein
MIYLKSVAAGLAAIIGTAVIALIVLVVKYRPTAHGTPGWDPISLVKLPIVQVTGLLVFVARFYWESRRLSR